MTSQLFFAAARQVGQPDIVERFSALLGASLSSDKGAQLRQRVRNQGAIELLESWIAEDITMSPAEGQAALTEWEWLQRLLDEEYLADNHLLP